MHYTHTFRRVIIIPTLDLFFVDLWYSVVEYRVFMFLPTVYSLLSNQIWDTYIKKKRLFENLELPLSWAALQSWARAHWHDLIDFRLSAHCMWRMSRASVFSLCFPSPGKLRFLEQKDQLQVGLCHYAGQRAVQVGLGCPLVVLPSSLPCVLLVK